MYHIKSIRHFSYKPVKKFFVPVGMPIHLQNLQVKFVNEGHLVKVKVTGATKPVYVSCSWVVCLRLKGTLVHTALSILICI